MSLQQFSVDNQLTKAKIFVKQGDFSRAKNIYEKILLKYPRNIRALKALQAIMSASNNIKSNQPSQQSIDKLINIYNQGQFANLITEAEYLLKKYPESYIIWNIKGAAQKVLGYIDDALISFKQVVSLNPYSPEGLNNLGTILKDQGKLDEALEVYNKALALKSDYVDCLYNKGIILQEQGDSDGAIALYDKVLLISPKYIECYYNKGMVLEEQGNIDEAIKIYNKTLLLDPKHIRAFNNLGTIHYNLGKFNLAIKTYNQALEINPNYAEAFYNIGVVLKDQGKVNEAISSYYKALKINPNFAEVYNNIGLLHADQGDLNEALKLFQKALTLKPDFAEAYNNMGYIKLEQNDINAALSMFNRTVHIDKKNYKGFINIANIYELEGNHKSVIEACNKALFLKPDFEDARSKKLYQQAQICDWNGISNDKGFIPNLGINKQSIAPFSLLSLEDAPERHRKRSEIFTKDKFFLSPIEFNIRHKQQSRKIRVGYFSADFKEHVVSRLIIPILERHNRNDFQIYGYSIKPTNEDYIKKQLISSFDVYRDVTQITDKEIALLAREDEIDIAIDLNGYTQNSRTRIFAYRAAPIQISYLGYPGTMGASFMDYIIADHNLIPESSQSFYSEKPIYLPNTYMPGNNNSEISKRHLSREELGLPQNAFVFCAINNSYKITPQVFEIWTRLLQKVKGSVLWLLSPNDDVKFNLIRAASVNGISSDRLVFAEPKPYEEYIAQFSKADLFLDTFIYNAGATANHVLWAGLPIVTKIGKSYTSRMAASMLNAVGLGELVTKTDKEYEDLIFDLATNTEKLKRVREKLSKNRLSEPLFDTELYIRHLEEGYRKVYENYTQGNKTKIINII